MAYELFLDVDYGKISMELTHRTFQWFHHLLRQLLKDDSHSTGVSVASWAEMNEIGDR